MKIKIIERSRQIELQEQEILRREKELQATVMKPAEAEKYKLEKLADAEKQKKVLEAEAEAESVRVRGEAKAYAIQEKAKANIGEDWSDEEESDAAEDDQWYDAQSYYDLGQ